MKKITIGLLCLIGVMSCQVPESITIKGNPGVYLPLGSPFGGPDNPNRLERRISPEEIRKTMGNSGTEDKIKVYDYQGKEIDKKVQAYIIRYPIVEMKLDLNEYVNDAMKKDGEEKDTYKIPDNIQGPFPKILTKNNDNKEDPLFTVSLNDMAKLVEKVMGNPSSDAFGLQMTYDNETFAQNVQVKIPAFGINDYIPGKKVGNTLRFVDDKTKTFIPKPEKNPDGTPTYSGGKLNTKSELEIFVRITGPCSGTITPEMLFDWDSAIIKTTDIPINGKHVITNSLRTFLGEDTKFKEVTGYIYMDGIDTPTTITIKAPGIDIDDAPISPPNSPPVFPDSNSDLFKGSLPLDSLNDPKGMDLTEAFNSSSSTFSPNLEYDIRISEKRIRNIEEDKAKPITADLVILLPLQFKISTRSDYKPNEYVKLELKDLFPEPGKDDLFMRTGLNNPDDLLNDLDTIKITLEKFQNDITDDFHLLISSGTYTYLLDLTSQNNYEPFWKIDDFHALPYPFSPRFEILLEKDQNQSYGTLTIKRHPPESKFDFFLSVEAEAKIKMEL